MKLICVGNGGGNGIFAEIIETDFDEFLLLDDDEVVEVVSWFKLFPFIFSVIPDELGLGTIEIVDKLSNSPDVWQ